jgi:hypothetical protein
MAFSGENQWNIEIDTPNQYWVARKTEETRRSIATESEVIVSISGQRQSGLDSTLSFSPGGSYHEKHHPACERVALLEFVRGT